MPGRSIAFLPESCGVLEALDRVFYSKPRRCIEGRTCRPELPVATFGDGAAAAYLRGKVLVVEGAHPVYWGTRESDLGSDWSAFHEQVGGPPVDRCRHLALDAPLSVCFDAQAAVEMGIAVDVPQALFSSGSRVVPDFKINLEDKLNVQHVVRRPPRALRDGTWTVRGNPQALEVFGGWAIDDSHRASLERAFAKERCATTLDALGKMAPAVQRSFLGATKPEGKHQIFARLMDSGLPMYAAVMAGVWPQFLHMLPALTKNEHREDGGQ